MSQMIFDSLTHPTLTAKWPGHSVDASFERLTGSMSEQGIERACAVGMSRLENYTHEDFAAQCRRFPELVPVAGFDPLNANPEDNLHELISLGFRAVKIHPRICGINLEKNDLAPVFKLCGELGLVVFFCTYYHDQLERYPETDPFFGLVRVLKACPATKVILVHGGDVELLRYAQLVRHNPNLLLDLSHTFLKYEGSSLDADIRFLFQRFDRRICIGSDHPEGNHKDLRRRFEQFSANLAPEKTQNIAYKNIHDFLGLGG